MTGGEVVDVGRDALMIILKVCAPAMMAALIVGVMISVLQALTQVQEATLAFVPKIIAMFVALGLAMPTMGQHLGSFTHRMYDRIALIGGR